MDPLIRWATQAETKRWQNDDATVVRAPDLTRRDRLVVSGRPAAVAELLAEAFDEAGPGWIVTGDDHVVSALPGLAVEGRFLWMDIMAVPPASTGSPRSSSAPTSSVSPGSSGSSVSLGSAAFPGPRGFSACAWLDGDADVAEFLAVAAPRSYAQPGGTGVRRWAAIRGDDGALIATAAEAWSVPGLGFIGGVATRPDRRGQGLAGALCRFVTDDLLRTNERVALLTDIWNEPARRTYLRLGYTERPLAAATKP